MKQHTLHALPLPLLAWESNTETMNTIKFSTGVIHLMLKLNLGNCSILFMQMTPK